MILLKDFLVFLVGIAAGFINVVSAGGSFLTIPALTFLGLGVDVANGTNRLAILLQNVVASWKFHRAGVLKLRKALYIAVPMTVGSILGAKIAVEMDRETLKRILGFILLAMGIVLAVKGKFLEIKRDVKRNVLIAMTVFALVGVYGGFIQAGVGFFIILSLVGLEGMDVVEGNAYKVFSILVYNSIAIWIFVFGGDFDLRSGLILSSGNMIGAYFGTKTALEKGARWIKYVLIGMMFVSATLFITGF